MNGCRFALLAVALCMGVASSPSHAADLGVRVGMLHCTQTGEKTNLLIHSFAKFDCVFSQGGESESYVGESGIGLGLDLQWDDTKMIQYAVVSATDAYAMGSHALAGKYVGGKGSVALGIGIGAHALIGGGGNSFTLQPLALESVTGFGVAGGVSYLFLEPK